MSDTIILPPNNELAVSSLTTAELRAELAKGLSLTVATLQRLAAIWAELERRGEDLRGLRKGIAAALPLIASGALVAEAVVAFASRPNVLRAIVGLPAEQQRELANGTPVSLVVPAGDRYDVRQLPLSDMTTAQVRVAIGEGVIRDTEEQQAILDDRKTPKRKPRTEPVAEPRRYNIRADRVAGGLWIGKAFVPHRDIITALAELAGPELGVIYFDDEHHHETITVRVTAEEKAKIKHAEGKRNLPEWHIIREALRASGLI